MRKSLAPAIVATLALVVVSVPALASDAEHPVFAHEMPHICAVSHPAPENNMSRPPAETSSWEALLDTLTRSRRPINVPKITFRIWNRILDTNTMTTAARERVPDFVQDWKRWLGENPSSWPGGWNITVQRLQQDEGLNPPLPGTLTGVIDIFTTTEGAISTTTLSLTDGDVPTCRSAAIEIAPGDRENERVAIHLLLAAMNCGRHRPRHEVTLFSVVP